MMHTVRLNLLEHGRATEWLTSFILLGFAFTLSMPGDTLAGASFRAFVEIGADDATIAFPLAVLAASRMCALFINGNWKRSPILRLGGAIAGSSVFAMLAMAFYWPTLAYGAPISTGVGSYFILAAFDALSAYRSGADVRLGQQLSRQP